MEYRKIRIMKSMTLEEWLIRTIWELKNPKLSKPTSTWQVYVSLLYRLQEEGNIAKIPISKLRNKDCKAFYNWLIKRNKGAGAQSVMKTFVALINRAKKQRLTKVVLEYSFSRIDISGKTKDASKIVMNGGSIKSLTIEQWKKFTVLDLKSVSIKNGPQMTYWKEVYRDYCILLYELKSRPIDILMLRFENFVYHPQVKRRFCSYIPSKKKNMKGDPAMQFISPIAESIISKYQHNSKYGYIFPFDLNRKLWNLNVPAQFDTYYREARNVLSKINRYLKLIGTQLKLPFPFTLYVIRRTALTHAVLENKIPLPILAKMAGTSVRMIELHYTNYLHALADY